MKNIGKLCQKLSMFIIWNQNLKNPARESERWDRHYSQTLITLSSFFFQHKPYKKKNGNRKNRITHIFAHFQIQQILLKTLRDLRTHSIISYILWCLSQSKCKKQTDKNHIMTLEVETNDNYTYILLIIICINFWQIFLHS